jgi:hypothetical protein
MLTAPPTLAPILIGQFRDSLALSIHGLCFRMGHVQWSLSRCTKIIPTSCTPRIDFCPLDLVARLQIDTGSTRTSCCRVGCVFENSLDHFVPNSHRLGKPWSEVLLDLFESIAVGLKGTERDAIRPSLQNLSWAIYSKPCLNEGRLGKERSSGKSRSHFAIKPEEAGESRICTRLDR